MDTNIHGIVLIRHARSTANVDPAVYRTTPDHTIPLHAPDDDADALAAGEAVRDLDLDPELVCAWTSTYLRCQQTLDIVLERAFGAGAARIRRRESFLLREQEFGAWDGLTDDECRAHHPAKYGQRRQLADSLGKFYFRYPEGESRADVAQRMAIFIGKLHRSRYKHHIVALHGVTQRAFRMAWHNHSVAWFEQEPNPPNASVLLVRRDPASQRWVDTYLTS